MIKVGIIGYGNLGKGVNLAVDMANDLECVGIFTRRAPETVHPIVENTPVYGMDKLALFKGKVDVMIVCGGSATDLPEMTAGILKDFNTVDSFDTHAKIPEYFEKLDKVAKENKTLGAISIGWDPGLFSIMRGIFSSVLPDGNDYTFWGKGVSQGHSDAIRRIDGVLKAVQYTIPKTEAVDSVREGKNPDLKTRDKHLRECFVVAKDGADKEKIENQIKTMPNYFADYDTVVHFISQEEFVKNHSELPHGGFVLRSGKTQEDKNHIIEFSLKLDSNPQFTGSVLTAYARAVAKMSKLGYVGAVTVYDVPLKYLSPKSEEELRKNLL